MHLNFLPDLCDNIFLTCNYDHKGEYNLILSYLVEIKSCLDYNIVLVPTKNGQYSKVGRTSVVIRKIENNLKFTKYDLFSSHGNYTA